MTLAWHEQWSGRSGPCLVYRRDAYRFAPRLGYTPSPFCISSCFWVKPRLIHSKPQEFLRSWARGGNPRSNISTRREVVEFRWHTQNTPTLPYWKYWEYMGWKGRERQCGNGPHPSVLMDINNVEIKSLFTKLSCVPNPHPRRRAQRKYCSPCRMGGSRSPEPLRLGCVVVGALSFKFPEKSLYTFIPSEGQKGFCSRNPFQKRSQCPGASGKFGKNKHFHFIPLKLWGGKWSKTNILLCFLLSTQTILKQKNNAHLCFADQTLTPNPRV